MAEKMTADEARRILIQGGFSLTPDENAHPGMWTDGLPHGTGWGPITPDPDAPVTPHAMPELEWRGEADTHNHHIWRFDGRRRTYHH